VIRAEGLEVDLAARVVRRDGEEIHLTPRSSTCCAYSSTNRGRLVTYRELLTSVWATLYSDDTQVLRGHVATCAARSSRPAGRAT